MVFSRDPITATLWYSGRLSALILALVLSYSARAILNNCGGVTSPQATCDGVHGNSSTILFRANLQLTYLDALPISCAKN